MKRILIAIGLLLPAAGFSQNYPHYTMFMYNKLIYNPAYAGSRDVLSINGSYRNQWSGIDGAPTDISLSVDAPVGSKLKDFNPVAVGLVINKETQGPIATTNIATNYAYRIKMEKSTLSFGLQAGVAVYNAQYGGLNPLDKNDPLLATDIKNAILPNFGTGVYWYNKRFYLSLSCPNILEDYFDKNEKTYSNGQKASEVRGYFLSGGYTLPVSEHFSLLPQVIMRYTADGKYSVPFNTDLNLSAIFYQRLLIGATYRTDGSVEGIVHLQVAKRLNIGYSYDYSVSDLSPYAKGTNELTIGFDFIRDIRDYTDPRFVSNF
ncbi:MAG: type IX secretion system membrane protein PorP/SprF [Flavipsychrobacter sp.]|nr:type IX secretion system membrane protein PorP/SprF [Flavipsychrobacter sp.]